MNKLLTLFCIIVIFLSSSSSVLAAKKRIRTSAGGGAPAGISYSAAKLNRASHSIDISFRNLTSVSKITYQLAYTSKGIPQGIMGTVTPTGSTDARNFYFGTCSKGVCTPHVNIQNATLTIRATLKTGGTNVKIYRIKWVL